jgi:hypothetical protein
VTPYATPERILSRSALVLLSGITILRTTRTALAYVSYSMQPLAVSATIVDPSVWTLLLLV